MRTIFIGTGDIGLPSLRWLLDHHEILAVVAQPDKPAGRGNELRPPATKLLALERGVPVLQPAKIRTPESVAALRELAPELIVVMAYGQILPKSLLEIPPRGCLNLHASILPLHRGAAPIQAAMLAGDAETGVTVMFMDEGLDTGDALLIERTPIFPHDTGGSLHDRLGEVARDALAAALPLIAAGTAPRTPQDPALATYAPKLERGHGQLDWTRPAAELALLVRTFQPWPGTFAVLPGGKKLKVHAAEAVPGQGAPGTVLTAGTALEIACGDGALRLLEIQADGKKRMPAADFLRGSPIATGTSWLAEK